MRRSRVRFTTLLAILVFTLTAPVGASRAADGDELVFVLDASGSMWGRIDGEMKIVVAKEVLGELLAGVPDRVDVGLVVYGHRRKGDCGDIEVLAAPGGAPDAIAASVADLVPRGRTPLTDSLREAAGLLDAGSSSTVVLVSDGIETCDGDPCALAAELHAAGTDLVIHTVGFGVDSEAAAQLQCVADAAGGFYFDAANADGLRDALFAVRDAVVDETPVEPPAAAEVPTEAASSTRIRIAGPGTIALQPADWVRMPPYYWLVLDAETGEEVVRTSERSVRAPAGEYQIAWNQAQHRNNDVPLTEVVAVQSRVTSEVPIDTGLRLIVPDGVTAPYRWTLRLEDEEEPLAGYSSTLDPQVVPAGTYRLGWWQTEHASRPVDLGTVEIEAGRLNDRLVDSGIAFQAAEWIPGDPYYLALEDADGDRHGFWRQFGPHLVGPGTYTAVYRQSEHGHSEVIWGSVQIPEHGMTPLAIDSGVRFIAPADLETPYRVFFVDLDTGAEIVWSGDAWDAIPVPPGRYRLDWHEVEHGSTRMTVAEEIEIPAGTLVEIEI